MNLTNLSITEASGLLQSGGISAIELTEAHLEKIADGNPRINAFITLTDELARKQAKAADQKLAQFKKKSGKTPELLCGIPIAVKDLYETAGIRTTAGSKFFSDYIPATDAYAVERLYSAGAVLLGKLNMHEIALGVTTVNPHFGTCRNPLAPERICGGSSGGSAAALTAGFCMGSLGSDTGGSIRIPSSLCGCVGLKPTYGRVSVRGVIPLSWNLDHAGPMARNVSDVAILLQAISGYDPREPYSVNSPTDEYCALIGKKIKGMRIALAQGDYFNEKTDPEVIRAIDSAALVFRKIGARVESVDLSFAGKAAIANGIITISDAAAFHEERLLNHPDDFGDDVRQRLEVGAAVPSTQYINARHTQVLIRHRFKELFENHDLLLTPTTPVAAPFVAGTGALEQAVSLTRFTGPFNLAGLPALSLPCGFTDAGLPIGLQICGPQWSEAVVLQAAFAFEREYRLP